MVSKLAISASFMMKSTSLFIMIRSLLTDFGSGAVSFWIQYLMHICAGETSYFLAISIMASFLSKYPIPKRRGISFDKNVFFLTIIDGCFLIDTNEVTNLIYVWHNITMFLMMFSKSSGESSRHQLLLFSFHYINLPLLYKQAHYLLYNLYPYRSMAMGAWIKNKSR